MSNGIVEHSEPVIPRGMNWGAFFLTWIWAIRNRSFNLINLLLILGLFLPYAGPISALGLSLYNGLTGYRRAYANGRWKDEEHFLRVQRGWSKWGTIQFFAAIAFVIISSLLTER